MHLTRFLTRGAISLSLLLVANPGGPASTLYAQAAGWSGGWTRMEDSLEHAFTLEVPRGWTWSGGAYRLGYGDIRAMVDVWSPDGKTNLRFGDLWFSQPFALPNQYHREGEAQDLGAIGQGIYAAYRTGQQFAEIYAHDTFRGVCQNLSPQKTDLQLARDTSMHRQGSSQYSEGEVTFQCDTPKGPRIAFAYAKTTMTTSQALSNLPSTTGWTPLLVSYLAPPDQLPIARSIARHFGETFKVLPTWVQHQSEMDRQGTAYAIARAQQRMTQQQEQFSAFTQRMNDQVSHFQQGQSRQQAQVGGFLQALNGEVPTSDPGHPLVEQGTHAGKWVCGGQVVDSDLPPDPSCRRIK
jgi:hypothetical protein